MRWAESFTTTQHNNTKCKPVATSSTSEKRGQATDREIAGSKRRRKTLDHLCSSSMNVPRSPAGDKAGRRRYSRFPNAGRASSQIRARERLRSSPVTPSTTRTATGGRAVGTSANLRSTGDVQEEEIQDTPRPFSFGIPPSWESASNASSRRSLSPVKLAELGVEGGFRYEILRRVDDIDEAHPLASMKDTLRRAEDYATGFGFLPFAMKVIVQSRSQYQVSRR